MPFLLLICMMAACLPVQWPEPIFGADPLGVALVTLLTVLFLVFGAALCADRAIVRLTRRPGDRPKIARSYVIGRNLLFFANLFAFLLNLFSFGWGWLIQTYCLFVDANGVAHLQPGVELLIILPFFLTLVGSWLVFYDADRAFHDSNAYEALADKPFWSRAGYTFFHFRQNMILVFFPALMMTAQQGLIRCFPQTLDNSYANLASMGTMPLVFLLLPLFLPKLLGLKTLPPGPTRERLHAHARRLDLGYRDILLWNTRGMAANAMVVGLIAPARYILFTDRLLNEFSEEEVDSVLGHEIGHVKHGHMLYYALFMILSIFFLGGVAEIFHSTNPGWVIRHPNLFMIIPVAFLGFYMFVVFGFISRNCERQADLYGAKAVSCGITFCGHHEADWAKESFRNHLCQTGIRTFVAALEKVAEINGLQRNQPRWRDYSWDRKPVWLFEIVISLLGTWQHSTIQLRVRYLESLLANPSDEMIFQRKLGWIKAGLVLILIAGIVATGSIFGWQTYLGDIL